MYFNNCKISQVPAINPGPAEPGYALPFHSVDPDQLVSKKPADLDLHCLQIFVSTTWIK